MTRLIVDDKIPFIKGILEPFAEVNYIPGGEISSDHLKQADGLIIRTRTKCNRELLESGNVKFISTATIGFDHIDTAYCEKRGIYWTNAPGCNSGSVMQYMASVLMHLEVKKQRSIGEFTIGIIGAGNVGKKIVTLARALGMNVLVNDPPRARSEGSSAFTSLTELLRYSDIISLHTPLNVHGEDKTFHLADESFFKLMKPQSCFINASRGEVCNSSNLKNAYRSEIVKDIVLDVWENEPSIDLELMQQCSVATPHIAGYSTDGKANGTAMSVQACSRFFGFNLNNWYPENIPAPENSIIDLTSVKQNNNENIRKAILSTYAVCEDDSSLRAAPLAFEKLRGNYRGRREFQAYSIKLDPAKKELANILNKIGFNISI